MEHILLRPDTYVGSCEMQTQTLWVFDEIQQKLVYKEIRYVPAFYKIYDEILVNAADNYQKDKSMNCIKIDIKPEDGMVRVWNNGSGIPVTMHKEAKCMVP